MGQVTAIHLLRRHHRTGRFALPRRWRRHQQALGRERYSGALGSETIKLTHYLELPRGRKGPRPPLRYVKLRPSTPKHTLVWHPRPAPNATAPRIHPAVRCIADPATVLVLYVKADSGRIRQIGPAPGNTVSYVMCKHGNHTETRRKPTRKLKNPCFFGLSFQEVAVTSPAQGNPASGPARGGGFGGRIWRRFGPRPVSLGGICISPAFVLHFACICPAFRLSPRSIQYTTPWLPWIR